MDVLNTLPFNLQMFIIFFLLLQIKLSMIKYNKLFYFFF